MTQKSFKIFILLCFFAVNLRAAQLPDTIRLSVLPERFSIIESSLLLATSQNLSAKEAWIQLQEVKASSKAVTVGFTSNVFWIALTIENDQSTTQRSVLEIDNPQIDWLYVYETDQADLFQLLTETGDKYLFTRRPLLHRNFAIPIYLSAGQAKTILIKIDKRNSSLTFPVYLWSEKAFHEKSYSENLWFGIFFGTIILCLGYALMAFIFLRKALYGWYFMLVFTSATYLFTALGYSFQYVYPNVLDFNSYFRVYLIAALFLFVAKFSQNFLNLPKYQPLVHKLINLILIALGILALGGVVAMDFMTRNGLWIIPIINTLMLLGGLLLIFGAIRSFANQRTTVVIYFLAWGSLLLGYLIMTASEFGVIAVEDLPVNPVLAGSSLEVFIFSIGLTYQVRKIYNERNLLSLNMAKQQKELLKAYVEGTEKERERIARELHDDIGSRLGSLKRFINTNERNTELENQIDIICKDVRTMSHQLAPPSMQVSGLRQLVKQVTDDVSKQTGLIIDAQYYDLPDTLSGETIHHLFRIVQEGLNNIVKHAHATEVDLQFFVHEKELVLTIEDNGRGFDTSKNASGIGLQNMKVRTESLNGTIEVSSQPGSGTNIMIRIPITDSTASS
ncbi:hypothetical protein SanaruYs_28570 [Chryseotalea sanaruensis]|uniref:Oxygen sensor histidine kinase NreB n=1 Tax=Chryseotalea sanaruensis TaxID=2482724 RepID=A0A401UCL6_9BACT|nr:7TM diverse intracellular signaling domain-containing protein [Chryseotalea sanaruensis]GCC52620.1 hypothetical protein SanaruYs_28570 [Chryseotalea sanaruensis]